MNKKGFTLIELLTVITIIALIATIASINIVSIFEKKEENNTNTRQNIITTAACLYIELNGNENLKNTCLKDGCEISTNTLINAGILKSDDVDNDIIINIYSENNEKRCIIKED